MQPASAPEYKWRDGASTRAVATSAKLAFAQRSLDQSGRYVYLGEFNNLLVLLKRFCPLAAIVAAQAGSTNGYSAPNAQGAVGVDMKLIGFSED